MLAGDSFGKPFSAGAHDVYNGRVVSDLAENWLGCLQLSKPIAFGQLFHALQFGVEGQFLIPVVEVEAARKFEGARHVLEEARELLDWHLIRIIEACADR